MNCLAWLCSVGVGDTGYVAVMEWRRVQEERPSCSTSGGQSVGGAELTAIALVIPFLCEVKSASELHVRQLHRC